MRGDHQLKIRLPSDLKAFVADQAEQFGSSQGSEIIRAIRERMQRETKSASGGVAPPPKASPET